MPIACSIPISPVNQDAFHEVDRVVMRHSFEIHNEFGGLLEESAYKTELADRLRAEGRMVDREALIRVTHGQFAKDYFIDLLVDRSIVLEAKTVTALTAAHHGQGINYLLLAGVRHGSLINFRGARVARRYLSTTLTHEERRRYDLRCGNSSPDSKLRAVCEAASALASDIGLGLDVVLYRDALSKVLNAGVGQIPILGSQREIGRQETRLLSDDTALSVTCLAQRGRHRIHVQRWLSHTPLASVIWVNLRLGHIDVEHIRRS